MSEVEAQIQALKVSLSSLFSFLSVCGGGGGGGDLMG